MPAPMFPPTHPLRLHDDSKPRRESELIARVVKQQIDIAGAVVYAWLLNGFFDQKRADGKPATQLDEQLNDKIQDAILMENRDRKYAVDALKIRGSFRTSENELDFMRFGMILANDIVQAEFATAEVERLCGRRLTVGDVLELPHMRNVGNDGRSMTRFYEVKSIIRSPSGWDHAYVNHILAVTMKPIKDAQEFIDLMERRGKTGDTIRDEISNRNSMEELTGKVQQAAVDQSYTTWWDISTIYFDPDTSQLERWTDDATPPPGVPINKVSAFPGSPTEGDYVVRVDFYPSRLYRYQQGKWLLKEIDRKREWGTYNWVKALREHMRDGSLEDDLNPWELVSIHDLATHRHSRSDPSPRSEAWPSAPDVGSWSPLIVLSPGNTVTTPASQVNTVTVVLAGNVTSPATVHSSLDVASGLYRAMLVQYTAERDTGQRVGEMIINDDGTATNMQHEWNDIGTVGLTFTVDHSGGYRRLRFTSTAGNAITLRFRIRETW